MNDIFKLIRSNNLKGIRAWVQNENVVTYDKMTPLHYAIELNNEKAAEIFVKNDLYIQSANCNNNTPLHLAVIFGLANLVSLLIERGAIVNVQNKHGDYPLHWAAENGHSDAVLVLIESGAKINVLDKKGETPLEGAIYWIQNIEATKILLNEGASLLTHDDNGNHYLRMNEKFISLLKRHLKLQKFVSCRKKLFLSHGVFLKFLNTFKFSFIE